MYVIISLKKVQFQKKNNRRVRTEVIEQQYASFGSASAAETLRRARYIGMLGNVELSESIPEGASPFEVIHEREGGLTTLPYNSNNLYAR